jgi:hypothetical protein
MPATVSHALSMTTPNDAAFENQPQHWNSSHLVTFNAVGSEISGGFANAGGVTFGYDGTNVTAVAPAGAPSPINFSAGTTSSNIGSVVFSNSNGVSFGLNGSTITGTVATNYQSQGAYLTTAALSGDTTKYAGVGETVGTVAGTDVAITMNTDGLSLLYPKYITTAMASNRGSDFVQATAAFAGTSASGTIASNGISVSIGPYITTGALSNHSHGVTAANGGFNFQTLSFSNANGISFGTSAGSAITGSHNAITTGRASTDAIGLNTAQSNVTWTVNSSGLSLDARGYAGTGTSATNASITLNSVGLAISVAAPGAGVAAGVSNTGNTLGNTGTVSSGTLVFAASGGITASESTAAGQSTIWYSAPATSSIVGTSGLSISTAGSTISALPVALSVWDPYPIITGTAVSSHAPASFWFSKMILNWPVVMSYANVLKSLSVGAPGMSSQNSSLTNKFSYSHGLTLFTRNGFGANSSQMSQWTTASFGMTGSLSQSSSSASVALSWVTNSTGGTTSFSTTSGSNLWTNFFTGMQMFRIPLVTTLTPGEYFIGQAHSSTTATVGSNFTLFSVSNLHIAPQSNTFATITSSGSLAFSSPEGHGVGVASAVTTNNTMAMSVISAGTQNWWYMNFSNT